MLFLRKWAASARARLMALAAPARAKLIDDVRRAWLFASLQFGAAALVLQSVLIGAPDVALQAWAALPTELKALLPVHFVNIIAAVLTALAMFARVWKQKAPANG